MFELQVRPIDQWPRPLTQNRKRSPFAAPYGRVMDDVQKELEHLGARSAVMLVALGEDQIRLDGRPRSGATPAHPGVILVAETKAQGTLRFPCDTFDDWMANLRAITLHLEALRRIDRYGVSVGGEQYKGWAALPPPNGDHWTKQQAAEFLAAIFSPYSGSDPKHVVNYLLAGGVVAETVIRDCEKLTHPDVAGGEADKFKKVQQARKLLLG